MRINRTVVRILFSVLAALVAPPPAMSQVPLLNPSFEQPVLSVDQNSALGQASQPMVYPAGNGNIHFPYGYGWQTTGQVRLVRGEVISSIARFAPPMGNQWISLRTKTAVYQDVTLAAGTYSVSLSAMQWMDTDTVVPLTVSIGSQQVVLTPQSLASAASGTGIPKMTFTGFTIAVAGTYTLRLEVGGVDANTTDPFAGVWLDDVVINNVAVNSAPSVEIIYPSSGQAISATAIPLRATAIDPDSATITKVEFYDLNTSTTVPVGTVTQKPWTFLLTTSSAATRRIVAKAYDGVTSTTSAEVLFTHNPGGAFPYVLNGNFENPQLGLDGSVYNSSSTGWLTSATAGVASASALFPHGGALTQPLEGLQSGIINPDVAGQNIQMTVTGLPAGNLGLSFRARIPQTKSISVAAAGASATLAASFTGRQTLPFNMATAGSALIKFTVPVAGTIPYLVDDVRIGPAGTPTASLVAPFNNQVFEAPTAITLLAKSDSFDRNITSVEYFANGILSLGTAVETVPLVWFNPPPGTHSITARIKDSVSGSAVSVTTAPVSVIVNAGPGYPGFFNGGLEYWSAQEDGRPFSTKDSAWTGGGLAMATNLPTFVGTPPEGISAATLFPTVSTPDWMSQDVPMPAGNFTVSFRGAVFLGCASPIIKVLVNGTQVGAALNLTSAFAIFTTSASFNIASTSTVTIRLEASTNTASSCMVNIDDVKIVAQGSGVPGAPSINSVLAGNANATVTFAAPASSGGSSISSYTATSTPGNFTGSCTAPCTAITVNGLTNGTAYTFSVKATNASGAGAASAQSASVTPATTPGVPAIGTAVAGNASATIAFTAPASNGGSAIASYTATSTPGSFTGTCTAPCTSISVTGLANGTAYTFKVKATNAVGSGANSTASNSVTPAGTVPGAPTIGTATRGNAQASITFTAPASNGGSAITSYTATSTPGNLTGTCNVPCTTVTVTGLTNGTSYTFVVKATNANGTGPTSAASNAVTPATVPSAPAIGTATGGNTSATISFTASGSNGGSAISSYTATSTPSAITGSCAAPCTSISVSGLANGTSYTFTVKATNAVGTSAASSASNAVTPAATVPGVPTIGTATAAIAQASVSFSAPGSNGGSAITGYTVTSSPGGVSASGATSPIVVTGLTNGTSYTFTVKANNAVGSSAASTASNAVTPANVPGAPTIGTASAASTQATVLFTAPASNGGSAIAGYLATSTPGGITGTCTAPCTTIVVSGLTNGTAYTFVVKATNAIGSGTASAASNSVTPSTVPGAPTIGAATAGNAQVSVAFTAPASNGGAAITSYAATCGTQSASAAASPVVVTGLANGTAVTCTVVATNLRGNSAASAASNSVTPTGSLPGAPTIGTATGGNASASVAFTAPASNGGSAITSYTVTSNPGSFTASGGAPPISVSGLVNGTSYTFTVKATNATGAGPASAASNAVVPATVPSAPTIGSATPGNAQATVTFVASGSNGGSSITSYTATSTPGSFTGACTAPCTSIVVNGLTNGTAYTLAVTATNIKGNSASSAASNSVIPATVPGAPAIGAATAGNASATITFSAPASNGGAVISSYMATSLPGNVTGTCTAPCTSITVNGLTNGTVYSFSVKATNALGTGGSSAASNNVTPVAAVPGPPVIGNATGGNAQASIGFTAPSSDGGAPVTSYTVTSNPDGISAVGNTSPLIITGLANGTAYTFTVRAANAIGLGAASAASNSVTPATVPGVPTIGTAVAGNSSVTVFFIAPTNNGGSAITSFSATCGGQSASGATSPIVVSSLVNGAAVTCSVRAVNSNGSSAPSATSNSVIPTSGNTAPLPPDPITVATPVDLTVATNLAASTAFLYTGNNPIQTGVLAGTINARRVSVLRGSVQSRDGQPLPAVEIAILGHLEFGQTRTRIDGKFDLAVNGGASLTIEYRKVGYLTAQRTIQVPWQDFSIAPEVVLIPLDEIVTTINLSSGAAQVAQGSVSTDGDGVRKATVLFPVGTTSTMTLPNGATQNLTTLNVRATEYTVGSAGPRSMPGSLPATSGYTYAVELSVDEAIAAGATTVQFNQPLPTYVENFLNFPVGSQVPSGYFDRAKGTWIPAPNGRVIKVLAVNGGIADLDTDGDGVADDATKLADMNIGVSERQQLAGLYTAGVSLWRVPVSHFTPWDYNWPYGPPPDATPPAQGEPKDDDEKDDCNCEAGSIIESQNQTLGERINLTGAPFSLNYRSDRVPGRKGANTLNIPLSGSAVPASLVRIELVVTVAGREFKFAFPPTANQSYAFTWDGYDMYNRLLQGRQRVNLAIGYVYGAVYQQPAQFAQSFGSFSGIPISGSKARQEITLWQQTRTIIGVPQNAKSLALGGWTASVHHSYDPSARLLFMGDGSRRSAQSINRRISNIAGSGPGVGGGSFSGDGGLATEANIAFPRGITLDAQGNTYISDTSNYRVRKISQTGIITTVAGIGIDGFSGDGGLATAAKIAPGGLAVDSSANIFIADGSRVRKVDSSGIITTVAGNGQFQFGGDGGNALSAGLSALDVAVDANGNLFISDAINNRIRKVDTAGIISTIAGNGAVGFGGDGGPATLATLYSPTSVAIDSQGNIYFSDQGNSVIRKVSPSGIITTSAGNGNSSFGGDGGPATDASFVNPAGIALDPEGNLYVADSGDGRIRKINRAGIISTVAGNGNYEFTGDGGTATSAGLRGPTAVSVDPLGNLFIADTESHHIRRVTPLFPEFGESDILIPSPNGSQLFQFSPNGRHLRTLHARTGATQFSFDYDTNGLLIRIADGDGDVTQVERDIAGKPLAIVSADGQRTSLSVNSDGWLTAVVNPAGEAYGMMSSNDGLLFSFTRPNQRRSTMSYDGFGRLISDQNAASGFWTLARTEQAEGHTVTMTSAEGRVKTSQIENLATGDERRTNTDTDGTKDITLTASKDTTTAAYADGTVISTFQGPDPRFGMQAPIDTKVTVRLPSGLTANATGVRTANLADPNNLLSLIQQTTTLAVNGRNYTSQYDATLRQYTNTSAESRINIIKIDMQGRPTFAQIAGVEAVNYGYDIRGRINGVSQGSGAATRALTLSYGSDGFVQSVTDAMTRQIVYQRDAAGRVTQSTLPGGRPVGFGYDAKGNVTSITPPGKPAHIFQYTPVDLESEYDPPQDGLPMAKTEYRYNRDKQLTDIARPDAATIKLTYDSAGRTSTVSPFGGIGNEITYAYSATTGQLNSLSNTEVTLGYTFDGPLLKGESFAGTVAGNLTRVYDANFRVTGLTLNGTTIAFGYDRDSLLTSVGDMSFSRNAANGFLSATTLGSVTTIQNYNAFGELASFNTNVIGSSLYNFTLTYDKLSRITTKAETVSGVTITYDYGYDLAGRLETVKQNGELVRSYGYDANGNRTNVNGASVAAYDDQDRIQTYGGKSFTFTANGDLQFKTDGSQTTQYSYDTFGNLRRVTLPDNSVIEYFVDGRNRRVGTKINGVFTKRYLWQSQLRIAAELDGGGTIVSRFVYGNKINVPEYLIKAGQTYRIATDHLGSVRFVVNVGTGALAQRIDYDEFGNVLLDTNPGFQPFGFAGGLYDAQTKLTRFGARDYDAESGRWTAKDPIGFNGGLNFYGYANQSPINNVDPRGRSVLVAEAAAVLAIGAVIAANNKAAADSLKKLAENFDNNLGKLKDWIFNDTEKPERERGLPPEGVEPPRPDADKCKPGPASRPSERDKGGKSLWDPDGGEWRYAPEDKYHNPHWDYNPWDKGASTPWQNIPIGGVPARK